MSRITTAVFAAVAVAKPFAYYDVEGRCLDAEVSDILTCESEWSCKINDSWAQPTNSIEECCQHWSVKDHDSCVKKSEATGPECSTYASKTVGVKNSDCEKLCEGKDASLEEKCEAVKIGKKNGNTWVEEGACYDKWVYGYSDEGEDAKDNGVASMGIGQHGKGTVYKSESSFACQELCQQNDDCVNWLFRENKT
ncbi:MAG: hypothetical protein KVP17_005282, partial [Porospora cf. gigantea B]|uniref:uncharacterized protein n=1 Tax=Porospora cf. gigantea B TaxID=2853592 RepID=UPI003571E1D6